MNQGARPAVLALFFVLGMAFMAALFLMARPDLLSTSPRYIATTSSPRGGSTFQPNFEPPSDVDEPFVAPPQEPPIRNSTPEPIPRLPAAEPALPTVPAEPVPVPIPPAIPPPKRDTPPRALEPATATILARSGPGGALLGRAFLLGDPPPEKLLPFDPACGRLITKPATTRLYVTGQDHSLADVLIVVEKGVPHMRWLVPSAPAVIVQRDCEFQPYISAMQLGQHLQIQNLDPVLHNVHIVPTESGNRERNLAQPAKTRPLDFTFRSPEQFIRIKCDVHQWMFAYVCIVDHPFFAVTGPNGRFRIDGLPPGRYRIEAKHRKAGTVEADIEISDRVSDEVKFEFTAPPELATAR